MRAYQETAAEIISRDGGYIAQYLGDGLLVYFGYPHAHEDDARRAVHAGLEIVETIKKTPIPSQGAAEDRQLAVRVGIHTGLVVVGEMGGGSRREQLALGETPNIAARIQASAAPNSVVASIATTRLLERLVVLEALGTQEFDGVAEPLETSRIVRVLDEGEILWRLGAALGLPGFQGEWDLREASRRLGREVPAFRGIDLDSVGSHGRLLIGRDG